MTTRFFELVKLRDILNATGVAMGYTIRNLNHKVTSLIISNDYLVVFRNTISQRDNGSSSFATRGQFDICKTKKDHGMNFRVICK